MMRHGLNEFELARFCGLKNTEKRRKILRLVREIASLRIVATMNYDFHEKASVWKELTTEKTRMNSKSLVKGARQKI
jgi:hypothetical protein